MKLESLRILKDLQSGRKPSGLFAQLDLVKDAWEAGFGVPTIVRALEQAGVTEGISVPNVQGFVRRCERDGLIGPKGCQAEEFHRLTKEEKKLPTKCGKKKKTAPAMSADTGKEVAQPVYVSESVQPVSPSSFTEKEKSPPNPVDSLKASLKAARSRPQ